MKKWNEVYETVFLVKMNCSGEIGKRYLVLLINISCLHHQWRTMTHLADYLKDDGRR